VQCGHVDPQVEARRRGVVDDLDAAGPGDLEVVGPRSPVSAEQPPDEADLDHEVDG